MSVKERQKVFITAIINIAAYSYVFTVCMNFVVNGFLGR